MILVASAVVYAAPPLTAPLFRGLQKQDIQNKHNVTLYPDKCEYNIFQIPRVTTSNDTSHASTASTYEIYTCGHRGFLPFYLSSKDTARPGHKIKLA